ncbi:ATP-grasp domain-containing protein [Anoxybacterium hadale]|uniref:ATP-grasp domain-containing protein n=1 Tax=Anoxybacterium hadale TaxID=3408580 RepID=A0ACD1A783_9FIRM|nr:ATP-grasp domain-containing protein [Clostridiales bacterium]
MIKRLLIANRGEIVDRIMRTCERLGIETVAVYSEADRDAPYLGKATLSYCIGPERPTESYLNINALMEAVKDSRADAVHPGYGFLSESAAFAEAVTQAGVKWIGPGPGILQSIESKCFCRWLAQELDIPVTPGTLKPVTTVKEIIMAAERVGLPVLLKLDKGGGGKGIEILENVSDSGSVTAVLDRMRRIGEKAFACGDVYVEKVIPAPRHIEVQFLADEVGNVICLGERECSIQRRYQKIIEESPSSIVSEPERNSLYEQTGKLVRDMGYVGAGTIEYLRGQDGRFYFMEVNARLQVEHPVTEFVTGLDLIEQQIKIANGEPLDLQQSDIKLFGHAIECRIYAEDSETFLPCPGTISRLLFPETSWGSVRVDHAIKQGFNVSPYYDPMLAKVIAWGKDRDAAVYNITQALKTFIIEGVENTIDASLSILESEGFQTGDFNTSYLAERKLNERITDLPA